MENDDGVWVRLSTESIRQHCQPGWYPLEAWCLQFNQHIDKTLLHPIIETTRTQQDAELAVAINDCIDTPALNTQNLATLTPEIHPRKSPNRKNRQADDRLIETNPFKDVFGNPESDQSESNCAKSSRLSRNPFEKMTKRSGKVMEDADDFEDYASQDEGEKSAVSSIESSSPGYYYRNSNTKHQQHSQIGTWTAGVMGGSSNKLQTFQKWFKSESLDGKESSRKRGDFTELASVSVRDLVKAIGGNSNDGRGNSPHQLSQCSSPISIPFSKLQYYFNLIVILFTKCPINRAISVQQQLKISRSV